MKRERREAALAIEGGSAPAQPQEAPQQTAATAESSQSQGTPNLNSKRERLHALSSKKALSGEDANEALGLLLAIDELAEKADSKRRKVALSLMVRVQGAGVVAAMAEGNADEETYKEAKAIVQKYRK